MGKVTVWYMTEEERQAYIKKHPIKKSMTPEDKKNFKWRGKKGAQSRWDEQ